MTFHSLHPADVQAKIADRLCITDACYLYAAAVDLLGNTPVHDAPSDHALTEAIEVLSQALTPTAVVRLFLSGASGPYEQLGSGGPAECAHAVRAYFNAYGYIGTHHPVSNVRIDFRDDDTADAVSTIPCYHWLTDQRMLLVPVVYRDVVRRERGMWKIAARDILAQRFWVTDGYAPLPTDPLLNRPL